MGMKVKELIAKLNVCDPDAIVIAPHYYGRHIKDVINVTRDKARIHYISEDDIGKAFVVLESDLD